MRHGRFESAASRRHKRWIRDTQSEKMEMPREITPAKRQQAIESIAGTPKKLREALRGLNDSHWTLLTVTAAGPCDRCCTMYRIAT